jgi:molybdate transport system substrate-binding protein
MAILRTITILCLGISAHACTEGQDGLVHIYVAASAAEAVENVIHKEKLNFVRVNSAASSILARQIDRKAPAHVFISADMAWMKWLDARGHLVHQSTRPLMKNQLVVITHAPGAKWPPSDDADIRIAIGDPAHVPVGRYAQQALTKRGLWRQMKSKTVATANARAALMLAERGEVDFAIIYYSDALSSKKTHILSKFTADDTKPIIYPISLIKDKATPRATQVYEILLNAQESYQAFGFGSAS